VARGAELVAAMVTTRRSRLPWTRPSLLVARVSTPSPDPDPGTKELGEALGVKLRRQPLSCSATRRPARGSTPTPP
jgi:hypothetical protein